MQLLRFRQLLQAKDELEKALRERAMIYQVEAKEEAALLFDLPLDFFFRLSYDKWSSVSSLITDVKRSAEKAYDNKARCMSKLAKKQPSEVTMWDIWRAYLTSKQKAIVKQTLIALTK